jgi:hypothetical protein
MLCWVCQKSNHFDCISPSLATVPECNWKCNDCFACTSCGIKRFFSEEDVRNKVHEKVTDFALSCHFELCYQCGIAEQKKTVCSICHEKTGLGHQMLNNAQHKVIQLSQISDKSYAE